jgi:hypothetical protein
MEAIAAADMSSFSLLRNLDTIHPQRIGYNRLNEIATAEVQPDAG